MTLPRRPFRAPKTDTRAGLEARLLVEYGQALAPGDLFTYEDMQELTGHNCQVRRDLVYTAFEILQTVHGKVFKAITGVGYVCLSEPGKVGKGEDRTQRTFRAALRTRAMLDTVDLAQLTPTDLLRHEALQTVTAAVALYTHERTLGFLGEARVNVLALNLALDALAGK